MVYIPRKKTEAEKERAIQFKKDWETLAKEPLIYEWEVLVNPDPKRWIISLGGFGIAWIIGLLIIGFSIGLSIIAIVLSMLFFLSFALLTRFSPINCDAKYHYYINNKAILYTKEIMMPKKLQTTIRYIAWFCCFFCIASVIFFGPVVLAGAGGSLLMAFSIKDAKLEIERFKLKFEENLIIYNEDNDMYGLKNGKVIVSFDVYMQKNKKSEIFNILKSLHKSTQYIDEESHYYKMNKTRIIH